MISTHAAGVARSETTVNTRVPPSASRAASRRSASRSTSSTCAPCSRKVRAVATPMPPAPPVMTTRLPVNSTISGHHRLIVERGHHLDAAHVARLVGGVVGNGVVHGTDIVPHQHVALGPVVCVQILGAFLVPKQEVEDLAAFVRVHVVDGDGVAGVGIE